MVKKSGRVNFLTNFKSEEESEGCILELWHCQLQNVQEIQKMAEYAMFAKDAKYAKHAKHAKYAKHIKYAKPKVGRGRRVHESSYGTVVAAAQCQLHFLTFHVSVVNQFQGLEPQPMRQPSKYVRYKNKTA